MKSFSAITFILLFLVLTPLPLKAIQTGIQFGGYATGIIPCTCSGGSLVLFSKGLHTGLLAPVPNAALYYQLGVSNLKPYANFNAGTPFAWYLGSYTPVPAAQLMCLVGIPPACIPAIAPVAGLGIIQYTGTSRPALGAFGF